MRHRTNGSGPVLALVGALGLASASAARADTIYLKPMPPGDLDAINRTLEPARLFRDATGVYVRGRIVGLRKGSNVGGGSIRAAYLVDAWWRPRADADPVWSTGLVPISAAHVARIVHEFDDDLDLRLMLSSRDQLVDEDRPSAPIGTRPWVARLLDVFDPAGALGVGARRQPGAPIPPDRIEHPGWVADRLQRGTGLSTADARRRSDEEMNRTFSSEENPFHPMLLGSPPDSLAMALLEGMARNRAHGRWARRQDSDAEGRPLPQGQRFDQKCATALAFLASLARADAGAGQVGQSYRDFGAGIRAGVLQALQAGARGQLGPDDDPDDVLAWRLHLAERALPDLDPAELDPETRAELERERERLAAEQREVAAQLSGSPRPAVDPAAQLRVTPTEIAWVALDVLQEFSTFWLHAQDGERLVRALVALGRQVDGPDPRRRDGPLYHSLPDQAVLTLVRLLRPNLATREVPAPVLREAAARFREDLDELLTEDDEATRELILAVLTYSGRLTPLASRRAIDGLFADALAEPGADTSPEGRVRAQVAQRRRRFALTMLVILGNLAGPEYDQDERAIGEDVIERLQVLRDRDHDKTAAPNERGLVRALDALPGAGGADEDLRERAKALFEVESRTAFAEAQRRLDRSRRALEDALARGRPADELDRLRGDVERVRTRVARLRGGDAPR